MKASKAEAIVTAGKERDCRDGSDCIDLLKPYENWTISREHQWEGRWGRERDFGFYPKVISILSHGDWFSHTFFEDCTRIVNCCNYYYNNKEYLVHKYAIAPDICLAGENVLIKGLRCKPSATIVRWRMTQ